MSKENLPEYIECPYCHTGHAVKLWFVKGSRHGSNETITLADFAEWVESPVVVTTNPGDSDCMRDLYVCPQCGRIAVMGAEKVADDE